MNKLGVFPILILATVLAACGETSEVSESESDSAVNGSMFISKVDGGTSTLSRYPIGADGSLGAEQEVYLQTADATHVVSPVDGVGNILATTNAALVGPAGSGGLKPESIDVRDLTTGEITSTLDAPDWCGVLGFGFTYSECALAGPDRLVRTSEILMPGAFGGPEESPNPDVTIWVSSLQSGEDLETLGPIRNLQTVSGTSAPDILLITVADNDPTTSPDPSGEPMPVNSSGTLQQLDLATGQTTRLGTYPASWFPVCPIGTGAMLGYVPAPEPANAQITVVGDSPQTSAISLDTSEFPVGCSADGKFLYVQSFPLEGRGSSSLDKITLADGTRTSALELPESGDVAVQSVTR